MWFNLKRRRIYYVDRIFQKKLLLLFLGINCLIVAANVIYYVSYLKQELQDNMYRMHITLSNLNQLIADQVVRFNLILALAVVVLVTIFYFFTRRKIRSFFKKIQNSLAVRMSSGKQKSGLEKISPEFQDIDKVITDFLEFVDQKRENEQELFTRIKAEIAR